MPLSEDKLHELQVFANQIRLTILESLNHLGFGHYGGSLSIVETLAVLYGDVMPMTPELFAEKNGIILSYRRVMLGQLYTVPYI